MRKLALLLTILVAAVLGLWAAALLFLPDAAPPAGQKAGDVPPAPAHLREGVMLAVPVAGMPREALRDNWGDPRDNGLRPHHGTDIMAAPGMPVVAAAPGRIEKLWNSAAGGLTAYVRSPQRKWTYYYAHLSGYAPGVHEGQVVKTGDPIGYVGDTGNAGAGNYHLHFGLTRTSPEQKWYEGRDVDPYPYLAGKPSGR